MYGKRVLTETDALRAAGQVEFRFPADVWFLSTFSGRVPDYTIPQSSAGKAGVAHVYLPQSSASTWLHRRAVHLRLSSVPASSLLYDTSSSDDHCCTDHTVTVSTLRPGLLLEVLS